MGRTSEAMRKKILEKYRQTPNYNKVADELGLNPKTVAKYARLDGALASEEKPGPAATAAAVRKENKFPIAINMLESGRQMVEVAAELGLEPTEAETYFEHYAKLKKMDFLVRASKKDPDSIVKTADLLQLLEKEAVSPSDCIREIRILGSLKTARDAHNRLQNEIREERSAAETLAAETESTREELLRTKLTVEWARKALAEIEAKRDNARKECASLEGRSRKASVNLRRMQSSIQTLERHRKEIIQQVRNAAMRDARAVLSNDPRIVKSSIGALVKCIYRAPSILFTLWTMIVNKQDPATITQHFEPLARAMLNEIQMELSNEVADKTTRKALFSHHAY